MTETQLRNITSENDRVTFKRILNSNINNQTTFRVFSDRNNLYVKFYAKKYVSSDNKLLLEFYNGVKVVLEGGDVLVSNRNNADRSEFAWLEGCPMFGPRGEVYIVLNNGQRFAMQSSYYSRTEENYVINSGQTGESHSSWQGHRNANDRVETSVVTRTRQESHSREQTYETYGQDKWHQDKRYRRDSDSADEEKTKQLPRSIGPKSHLQNHLKTSFEDGTFPACEAARCVQLKCTLGPLLKDEEVSISMKSCFYLTIK